jgi:beta-N-acetylhexosaminidase
VMTAHILVPELDEALPASLSEPIVSGLLRQAMGFDGVVVSDDLEMKAVAARWPIGEAAVRAASAGVDLIAICSRPDLQVEAAEALVRAVESQRISWKAMEDSLGRIRRFKESYLLPYQHPDPRRARSEAGRSDMRELALEIAERGGLTA